MHDLFRVTNEDDQLVDGKSIPGTPLWMAPEVMLGSSSVCFTNDKLTLN
jgi:serine/threonine protein kinase